MVGLARGGRAMKHVGTRTWRRAQRGAQAASHRSARLFGRKFEHVESNAVSFPVARVRTRNVVSDPDVVEHFFELRLRVGHERLWIK